MDKRVDLPAETRCYDCRYRLSKVFSPINPEDFNLKEGTLVVDHMCCMTEEDISNIIVKDCTRYEKGNLDSLFVKQRFFE